MLCGFQCEIGVLPLRSSRRSGAHRSSFEVKARGDVLYSGVDFRHPSLLPHYGGDRGGRGSTASGHFVLNAPRF